MDWANEDYVKVYRRETDDDILLSWQAMALWRAMLPRFDRSGLLETKRGVRGLAAIARIPLEVVEPAIEELLGDGRVVKSETGYFAPNFLEAQETSKSDRVRQRESRMRRAESARSGARTPQPAAESVIDTTSCHAPSRDVTAGHAESQAVTLSYADPDPKPEQSEPPAPAREPAPLVPMAGAWARRKAWWDAMLSADQRIRSAGIEPNAPSLPPSFAGENEKRLAACERQLTEAGYDATTVDAKMRHIVAVAETEAIREGHRSWFKPALIWDPARASRSADTSLEEASRKRDGPPRDRSSGNRPPEPPSRLRPM